MTYHAPRCDDYFNGRVQPPNLADELDRLARTLSVIDGLPPTPAEVDRVLGGIVALAAEARAMPEVFDVECEYEGEVDADYQRLSATSGVVRWTCPRCGHDREDFREKGDED